MSHVPVTDDFVVCKVQATKMNENEEIKGQNDTDSHTENSNSIRSCESKSKSNKSAHKLDITSKLKDKLRDLPDVLEYIVKLQTYIEKQKKKLNKLKKKVYKEKLKAKTASTQTETQKETAIPKSITEEITEAAQEALQGTTFVYEETSGMYYDYKTGYYYNAEYRLFYDGNTGTYMTYNDETKEYEFHSQVSVPTIERAPTKPKATKKKKKEKRKSEDAPDGSHARKREKRGDEDVDLEEGECSDCSRNSCDGDGVCVSSEADDDNSSDIDYARKWPPSMRIIVEESNVAGLKTGSLHLVTYDGGTVGREGDHSVIIPDINVSKHHLRIAYDKETNQYLVTDLGSRNGTYLNGKRLSPSMMESEPAEILHGSRLQIGGTILLCHIHVGSQTCGHCEPGLLITKDGEEKSETVKSSKSLDHKQQLKQLRKKFGINQADQGRTLPASGYTDRAQVRRDTVGSQNPHEKTKVASLNESIDSENKGFKLLSKMGWKEGEALGKNSQGRLEPVELVSNPGTRGVGNTASVVTVELNRTDKQKQQVWAKTQERYNQIPEQNDIFEET